MNNDFSGKILYDGSRSAALLKEMRRFIADSCPGRRCPSQWQIAGKYNVSRSTVEKVLKQLASEGLIEIRRGAGAFVAGCRTIQFLMPGEKLLTRQDSDGSTVRERIDGCMQAVSERDLSLELTYISPEDKVYGMDLQRIARMNSSSMVILQDWFFSVFPELAKRPIKAALISSGNISYGYAQYADRWQQLLIDRPGGIHQALKMLHTAGCRRIAIAGHFINYCRALEMKSYQKFVTGHNMPVLALELESRDKSASGNWQKAVNDLYLQSKFDGLLVFCKEYLTARESLHKFFALPESVRIMAWNFYPELAPGIEPVPCFNAPNHQIGYDAVMRLLDDTRSRRKTVYPMEFKNLNQELSNIYDQIQSGKDNNQ